MGKIYKYWIIMFAFVGFTFVAFSQGPVNGPPAPTEVNPGGNGGRGPCGELPDGGNGGGPGIPPPVGLCLPINDYLLPLLLSGIALGSFMVWRLESVSRTS